MVLVMEERAVEQRWLNGYDAVARRTGLSVSTLRTLVEEGKLTPYRPTPRRVLFDLEQVDGLVLHSAVQLAKDWRGGCGDCGDR